VNKNLLIKLALIIPVLGILTIVGKSEYEIRNGNEYRVEVTGFDPRDMLSGHYIDFRFKWDFDVEKSMKVSKSYKHYDGVENEIELCVLKKAEGLKVYLINKSASDVCDDRLKGQFYKGETRELSFNLGIERFYIPEEHAKAIETAFLKSKSEVVFRVNNQGHAVLVNLYIDGKPWSQLIK
jgi:uncharacterized membrane-anchored protein